MILHLLFKIRLLFLSLFLILLHTSPLFCQIHNWTRTNPGGGGAIATVSATASGTILAASDLSGVYRSFDQGQSWDAVGANQGLLETHVSALGFHPTDGNIYFAGTYNGAYKTSDGGESFHKVFPGSFQGIEQSYIESIVLSAADPSRGYITHHPTAESFGMVYRTNDGGESWQAVPGQDLPDDLRLVKLMVHPQDRNLVYVLAGKTRWGCSRAHLFVSSDGGVHWARVGVLLGDILDYDLHPTDPDILFVSTFASTFVDAESCRESADYVSDDEFAGAFYKSIDGGNNFSLLADQTGIISVSDDPNVIRLTDVLFPYDWYDDAGTWETTDGGQHWSHTGLVENWFKGYTTNQYFAFSSSFNGLSKTLTKDIFHPDRCYGSFGQWAWGSFDGGVTVNNISTREITENRWLSTGLENINGHCLEINDGNPDLVMLGGYDIGFWYTRDRGLSWTRSLPDYNTYPDYVWDLGEPPVEPNMAVREAGANVFSILSDPAREQVVWATFSAEQYTSVVDSVEAVCGLFRSDEYGENWQLIGGGLPVESAALMMYGLSLDPGSPVDNRTLFMTVNGDVYRSEDDGNNWTMVLSDGGLKFTEVDRFNGDLVYAGGRHGVFRSTDGGDTWADLGHPELRQVHAHVRVDIVPTWTSWDGEFIVHPWEGVFDLEADPGVPGRIYATVLGSGKGLYRSDDAGLTWVHLLADTYMRGVAVAPGNSDIVYVTSSMSYHSGGVGNSLGIQYSTDAGTTWTSVNDGMAWSYGGMIAVANGNDPLVWAWSPGTGVQMAPVPALSSVANVEFHPASALHQNHPNPFNPSTRLSFTLNVDGPAKVSVHDLKGRHLVTLLDRNLEAGRHHVSWDGHDKQGRQMGSGVYLVRLKSNSGVGLQKISLVK